MGEEGGFSKGTLYYMKGNAKGDKPFTLNAHVGGGWRCEKEANNIDEQALDVKKAQEFINERSVYDFILNLTPEKARVIRIKHGSALAYLKKKAKEGELNFKARNLKWIVSDLSQD